MSHWTSIPRGTHVYVERHENIEFARCWIGKAILRTGVSLDDCGIYRRDPRAHTNEPNRLHDKAFRRKLFGNGR